MAACDYVIAESDTKIGFPETRRGLVAALVMTFLCRQVRDRDVRELLLRTATADGPRYLGMAHRILGESFANCR